MSTVDTFALGHAQYYGVELVPGVFDLGAQREFERMRSVLWPGKVPGFYQGTFLIFFLTVFESQAPQDGITIPTESLQELLVEQRNASLALCRIQRILQVCVEVVGRIHPTCHDCVSPFACQLLSNLPPLPQLGLVCHGLDIVVREDWWSHAYANLDRTLRR